jgi:hypothetical protein
VSEGARSGDLSGPGSPARTGGAGHPRRGTGPGFLGHQFLVACGAYLAPVLPEDLPRAEMLVTTFARGVVAEPDRSARAPQHLPADDRDCGSAPIVAREGRRVNRDVGLRVVP